MAIDPITAIGAVSTVLNIIDKVANQVQRFVNKEPEPAVEKPHGVQAIKETPTSIVVKREGRVVETITADDLSKLDPNSRALIKALEDSMQSHYDVWVVVYPQRDQSADPIVNAKVNRQLQDTAKKMCADLNTLFNYLDFLGKYLEDHYQAFRFVCQQIQS
jgi:hypothetical protein